MIRAIQRPRSMERRLAFVAFSLVFLSSAFSPSTGGEFSEEACNSGVGSSASKRDQDECSSDGPLLTRCSAGEPVSKPDGADEIAPYDTTLSLKMLLLSAAAYYPHHLQECLGNALPFSYFQVKAVVVKRCDALDDTCSGYVAISPTEKAIVVIFTGSEDIEQALDIFVESISIPKEEFLGGRVQLYWKKSFEDLWGGMEPKVRELRASHPHYKVWVTGHSLGGAIASLASAWLSYNEIVPREDIILYTFGSPRSGDYNYALEHHKLVGNSWRVVNFNDVVPHFPLIDLVDIFRGPYHHGIEVYYTEPATSVDSPHRECHGKPLYEDASCSRAKKLSAVFRRTT